MATAKAKTAVKKAAAKAAPKVQTKAPVKKAAPKAKAPKVVAKAAPVKKAKPVVPAKAVAKPVAHKPQTQTQKVVPPKNESVFARLLREKAERHEKFQKQNEHHGQTHDQRTPHNHASFAKFAGPRRRAS